MLAVLVESVCVSVKVLLLLSCRVKLCIAPLPANKQRGDCDTIDWRDVAGAEQGPL